MTWCSKKKMMQEKDLNNNERRIRISGHPPLKNSTSCLFFLLRRSIYPDIKKIVLKILNVGEYCIHPKLKDLEDF